jgi:hypothetical protein
VYVHSTEAYGPIESSVRATRQLSTFKYSHSNVASRLDHSG